MESELGSGGCPAGTAPGPNREYDLQNPDDLINFLIDANIRLVRLSYLQQLGEAGRPWPRRQEAEEGLVTLEEIEGLRQAHRVPIGLLCSRLELHHLKPGSASSLQIVFYSLSHCWEAQQHPDPFGFQQRRLLSLFSQTAGAGEEYGQKNVAVLRGANDPYSSWLLIDYICLPQYKRTAQEQRYFCRAMESMHVLYAHAAIAHVIRLQGITPTEELNRCMHSGSIEIFCETTNKVEPRPYTDLVLNRVPYPQRGWCVAEVQWMNTRATCYSYAPMLPAIFQEQAKRGMQGASDGLVLTFTHRDDGHAVVQLQEKVFLQQFQQRQELLVFGLPLDEVLVLAQTLPSLVNLESLHVSFQVREKDVNVCVAVLAESVSKCKRLREAIARIEITLSISFVPSGVSSFGNYADSCYAAPAFAIEIGRSTLHNLQGWLSIEACLGLPRKDALCVCNQ